MKLNFKKQGARLKDCREFRKMSQSELARKLKVKPQFICNIERGAAGIPPKYIRRLAEILKIPVTRIVATMVVEYEGFLYSCCEKKEIRNGHSKTNKK